MKKFIFICYAVSAVVLIWAEALAKTPGFSVLDTTYSSGVYDVSGDGSAAVGGNQYGVAFWQNGGYTIINPHPSYAKIQATNISGDGKTIGGRCANVNGVDDEAFIYTNGQATLLGRLPNTAYSRVTGINGNGTVVVGTSGGKGFRWENNQMTELPDLPGGSSSCGALGINGDGSTIIGYGKSSLGFEACRWANGQVEGLGVMSGFGYSMANAISANGTYIVGKNGNPTVSQDAQAFCWVNGTMTSLGVLPGYQQSIAEDVSNNGIVIGVCISTNSYGTSNTPFVWDSQHGMRTLWTVLYKEYGMTNISGWKLECVTGISDDGTTLVGDAIDPKGYHRAWIATIPEPASLLLLGLGGLVIRKR